jgi:hypothetical protein
MMSMSTVTFTKAMCDSVMFSILKSSQLTY